jgi:hypothetical protein
MYEFCITIGGVRRCFPVPTLIDRNVIHRPPPNNYPPFDLAVSVLLLTEAAGPSELSKQLNEVANAFIKQVQKELPKGVELMQTQAQEAQAA